MKFFLVLRFVTDSHTVYDTGVRIPGSVPALYDEHPIKVMEYLRRQKQQQESEVNSRERNF